ncbi:MAG: DUF937 domain-containing protein, partial [Oscillospiraceae bacterium]|nr:DUF937 domain-containing protein [Oscillospiraceae bacterium]
MDLNALMGTLLSQDSLQNMSSLTGASSENVASVLSSALPAMLSGAQGQANDENALAGFAGALQDHAKDDTSDIASFLSGVDLEDGGKIVAHLLGGNQAQTTQDAADKAGLDLGKTASILAAVAPLLMSLLGQQTQQEEEKEEEKPASGSLLGGLFGNLLGNVDMGSLILGLLGG